MGAARIPDDEDARLASLHARRILDTPPEEEFDEIVRMAAEICNVPIALVSLVDANRQWFKAKVGLDASETPRELAYCAHAILSDDVMEVPESSADPRFADNPLRESANVEFYAGVPLRTGDGHRVGTLCVIDHVPRRLTEGQRTALEALAAQVVRLLEARGITSGPDDDRPTRDVPEEIPERTSANGGSRAALAIAVLLGIGSIAASAWVSESVDAARRARLAQATLRAERFLEGRTRTYVEILRGASGLFAASEHVSSMEFRRFVETLALERNYPDLLGIGFTERVPRAELDAFLEGARAEHPSFVLRGAGTHPELAVIRYVEPLATNAPALGFDMRTSPTRARALDSAARTNEVTVTDRVTLLQDPHGGPGFLFYLPVASENDEQRGWVFVVVRGRALVRGVDHAAGDAVVTIVRDTPDRPPLHGPAKTPEHVEYVSTDVEVGNRVFALSVIAGPRFGSLSERLAPHTVFFLGLCATALSFALVSALRRTEARSRELAQRMTDSLRQKTHALNEVIDGTTDLILVFTEDGRITLANRAFRRVLGYGDAVDEHMSVLDVVHEPAKAAFTRAMRELGEGERQRTLETTFVSRVGTPIDVEGALTHDVDASVPITRAIFRDVSARNHAERALRAANTALERLASVDALTGVANRRTFDERITEEVDRARRQETPLALVMLDVDHFKLYNDRYGHPAGDECLRRVGGCMRIVARRAGEVCARYGGEEFALLLPGTDFAGALDVAERLRATIASMKLPHERHPLGIVTASLGLAMFTPDMKLPRDLVSAADKALYAAKAKGRNQVGT